MRSRKRRMKAEEEGRKREEEEDDDDEEERERKWRRAGVPSTRKVPGRPEAARRETGTRARRVPTRSAPPAPRAPSAPALPSQLRLQLEEVAQRVPVGAVDPVVGRGRGRGCGGRGRRDSQHRGGGTPGAATARRLLRTQKEPEGASGPVRSCLGFRAHTQPARGSKDPGSRAHSPRSCAGEEGEGGGRPGAGRMLPAPPAPARLPAPLPLPLGRCSGCRRRTGSARGWTRAPGAKRRGALPRPPERRRHLLSPPASLPAEGPRRSGQRAAALALALDGVSPARSPPSGAPAARTRRASSSSGSAAARQATARPGGPACGRGPRSPESRRSLGSSFAPGTVPSSSEPAPRRPPAAPRLAGSALRTPAPTWH